MAENLKKKKSEVSLLTSVPVSPNLPYKKFRDAFWSEIKKKNMQQWLRIQSLEFSITNMAFCSLIRYMLNYQFTKL